MGPKYGIIVANGHRGLMHFACGRTSWSGHDVEMLYCGFCKTFLEDDATIVQAIIKAAAARVDAFVKAPHHWVLGEDRQPKRVTAEECLRFLLDMGRRIVKQETIGRFWISTVATARLAITAPVPADEAPRPRLFELIVFDGPRNVYGERFETWEEAEAGHAHMAAYITACGRPPGVEAV